MCKTTPYPDVCFNTLKLSISVDIVPNLLNFLLHSLDAAIDEATKLSSILATITSSKLIEKQRGAVQDCRDLHQVSILALRKSVSKLKSSKVADAKALLSGALTSKATCLEGLASASGPQKQTLVNSIVDTYQHVSNSLSMLAHPTPSLAHVKDTVSKAAGLDDHPNFSKESHGRRLLMGPPILRDEEPPKGAHKNVASKSKGPTDLPLHGQVNHLWGSPSWLDPVGRRVLQHYNNNDGRNDEDDGPEDDPIVVAGDGSGNFTRIQDAINFAPNNSEYRTFIYVKKGVYEENVEIPSYKPNIVLLGEGSEVTVITGNRSVADGWTTFRSASVAVSGEGFLARDITFENTAGPMKHQAVALRINADLVAVYKCTILGFQDTLYVHSFRQFYRECDIYGTVDYIFGNAAVVFQGCNIVSRMPMAGQFTVITAQSRDMPEETTGISIQNCSILATEDLYSNRTSVKSYLGRPWREYARTVYIESYIDDFIDPLGWTKWSDDKGLDTLYYGEYGNQGPGSNTDGRVTWPGYHVMSYEEASNFTVSEFIVGDEWLDSTSFPYDEGI